MFKTKLFLAFAVLFFAVNVAAIAMPTGAKATPVSNFAAAADTGGGGGSSSGSNNNKDERVLPNDCKPKDGKPLSKDNCKILGMIITLTNVLSGLVGVVIVGMITFGGIRYMTAGGDPQKVVAARGQIRAALIALVLYIFSFAFLQWIVPGGLF